MATATTFRDALFGSMESALATRPDTIILGQGVIDHRGIFGTTTGLADRFGKERVIETPLSEEGVAGICLGAALNGLYPINTHIRVDFSLLAMNQIVNLAAKYKYMFGGLYEVPMLFRLIIGRSWGQGSQHSQSLQSLFAHIPGLTVLMPATAQAVTDSYAHAINHHRGPVVSIEHRILYDLSFASPPAEPPAHPFASRLERKGGDVTIVATSIMVVEAKRAAEYLAQHGISCAVIDLHSISHPDWDMVLKSVGETGRLLVADTSWKPYGVSAEICRIVAETDPTLLKKPVVTFGMQPAPCPTAKSLEDLFYPTMSDLVNAAATLARGADHGVPLPDARSFTDFYKSFKGPF